MGLYPHQRRKHTGTPVHLKMWQHSKKPEGALVTFTEREQRLLDVLKEKKKTFIKSMLQTLQIKPQDNL